MNRIVKIICVLNLIAVVAIWIPELIANEGSFLEELFRMIFIIFLCYALQGLLLFAKVPRRWDLISASAVLVSVTTCSIISEEISFMWLGAPVILYFCLQIIRNRIPDNIKILYLNIWNILIVTLYLFDRYSTLI